MAGFIAFEGPSEFDGRPIVGIVTVGSDNGKTGDGAQLWILDATESPIEALRHDNDSSVCGSCPLRGLHDTKRASLPRGLARIERSCYVRVEQAPQGVWKAYRRGAYPQATRDHYRSLQGVYLRLGAYGDPAAIPYRVVSKLARAADRTTGYTHAWRSCDRRFRALLMASCEGLKQRVSAAAKGWRAFVTVTSADDARSADLTLCPASKEAGFRATCNDCGLCAGTSSGRVRSVGIVAHGGSARYLREAIARADSGGLTVLA